MEDRRSSFPTHDSTPEPNILDGVYVRTENAPLEVIHKRYYILLLIGIILVGAFSFYAPTGMMRALHCEKRETNFIYTILSEDALSQMSATDITDFLGYRNTIDSFDKDRFARKCSSCSKVLLHRTYDTTECCF